MAVTTRILVKHFMIWPSLNFIGKYATKPPPCRQVDEPPKPTCKKKEEVPCEKLARGEDCTLIPHKPKEECPKKVIECHPAQKEPVKEPAKEAGKEPVKETAVATTAKDAKAEKDSEKGLEKKAEGQIMLAEPKSAMEPKDEEFYEPKVLIIGAGLAGLSAANRLITMGVPNVTLLEATSRPGGRIQSVFFGDVVVNLGGTWEVETPDEAPEEIDPSENPVMFHASKLGMIRSNKYKDMAFSMLTECDGTPLPLPPSFLALTSMKRILAVADSMRTTSAYLDQGRIDAYIGLRMQQELRVIPHEMKAVAARVFAALAMLASGKNFMQSDSLGPFITLPGCQVKIPLSCTGVLTPLLKNVSRNIKYCKDVCNISWGSLSGLNGRRAVIRTTDGFEYSADFVIYTPSLGVLKRSHESLFCPALPCPYVKAIESIEFEAMNKVFFFYKTPISCWRQKRIKWKILPDDVASLKGPLRGLREIKELDGSSRVLGITLVGKGALKSEVYSEKNLVEELTSYIRKKSGDCAPLPDDILRTKWSSNKYFRGGRAIRALTAKPLPTCGTPNPPVIFFAGDGTSTENVGNVRGSFISGLREADRILSFIPGKQSEAVATDACLQLQAAITI